MGIPILTFFLGMIAYFIERNYLKRNSSPKSPKLEDEINKDEIVDFDKYLPRYEKSTTSSKQTLLKNNWTMKGKKKTVKQREPGRLVKIDLAIKRLPTYELLSRGKPKTVVFVQMSCVENTEHDTDHGYD